MGCTNLLLKLIETMLVLGSHPILKYKLPHDVNYEIAQTQQLYMPLLG